MTDQRLQLLLERFPDLSMLVVGDFFLDEYLITDPQLTESSLETGLDAYQVVERRCSPGAAGTVTNNLRALGVGNIHALSMIGADGNGYELRKGLIESGVDTTALVETSERFTPTYTKPTVRIGQSSERELNRLDIKNRTPVPVDIEEKIIRHLRNIVPEMDGVIVSDQVQERNFGVITDRVRSEICRLAVEYSEKTILIDSRVRIGEFRSVIIKPNIHEAVDAVPDDDGGTMDISHAEMLGSTLYQRTGEPVYVTLSEKGILVVTEEGTSHLPAVQITGEIDPVGAGDSTAAGITAALCAGAESVEAAVLGNRVAAIVVKQLGTTGTATPQQILQQRI
jgi:rfaE bifunctional protein kinase chain/domain